MQESDTTEEDPTPLALCAVASDEHAGEVVQVARHLTAAGGYRTLFAHIVPAPVPIRPTYGNVRGGWPGPDLAGDAVETLRRQALEGAGSLFASVGVEPSDASCVRFGDRTDRLAELAEEHGVDLVVTGCRGRGALLGALMGSLSRTFATDPRWPVLVARAPDALGRGGPVVCGVAGALAEARAAVAGGVAVARRLGSSLTVAHVTDERRGSSPNGRPHNDEDMAGRQMLGRLAADLPTNLDVELRLEPGEPAARLVELADARDASVVVVGCRPRGALRSALEGSVSLDLVRDCERSVLIVPTSQHHPPSGSRNPEAA